MLSTPLNIILSFGLDIYTQDIWIIDRDVSIYSYKYCI